MEYYAYRRKKSGRGQRFIIEWVGRCAVDLSPSCVVLDLLAILSPQARSEFGQKR